jgi:hypothetical protein
MSNRDPTINTTQKTKERRNREPTINTTQKTKEMSNRDVFMVGFLLPISLVFCVVFGTPP